MASNNNPPELNMETIQVAQSHLDQLAIIERVGSVFSLLGCIFIIATFCLCKTFHKPINRLVFYASFGNMMTNVGTLMARSQTNTPDSPGCQFQAFLIQMFMPADAFWTLAMAINVYLTFYHKYDAQRLRRMELSYLLSCYGVPFIPAFTYIFLRNQAGERVYGNATLWCWVTPEWDLMRIVTFYGPIWVVILITFFIYLRAGRTIYEKRKQLHNISVSESDLPPLSGIADHIKTTEISVTSEVVGHISGSIGLEPINYRRSIPESISIEQPAGYSVTISCESRNGNYPPPVPERDITISASAMKTSNPARRHNHELNNAAWSYTKCAILFFTAMLITWIPSSANRVFSVVHSKQTSVPLEFMSALVLPLQGFWNAVIYIVTSWKATQLLFSDALSFFRRESLTETQLGTSHPRDVKTYDSESTTELSSSRSDTVEMKRY